jgi:hypothetical protein
MKGLISSTSQMLPTRSRERERANPDKKHLHSDLLRIVGPTQDSL